MAQNKCTGIVCSCYAPSREQAATATATVATTTNNNNSHELPSNPISTQEVIGQPVGSNDGSNSNRGSCTSTNGKAPQGSSLNPLQEAPLKSNLKKTTIVEEPLVRDGKRKVSWPDAHGKDLAHVQEFQSRYKYSNGSLLFFSIIIIFGLKTMNYIKKKKTNIQKNITTYLFLSHLHFFFLTNLIHGFAPPRQTFG